MTEPYRDPDGPIHAVLAAANTVAPRCHLPDGVSLVHARYQYPACVPEAGGCACGGTTAGNTACREQTQREFDEAKRRTRRDVAVVIT